MSDSPPLNPDSTPSQVSIWLDYHDNSRFISATDFAKSCNPPWNGTALLSTEREDFISHYSVQKSAPSKEILGQIHDEAAKTNAMQVDSSSDDSDSDEDSAEEVMDDGESNRLEVKMRENPNDESIRLKYIQSLRKLGDLSRLRQAGPCQKQKFKKDLKKQPRHRFRRIGFRCLSIS
eukprot:TRINITY_DN6688_c0_g1_i3.p1 TRINITY_DN6688_c0_g1~~TRINITY_DN6688_c0_g1_i3.p1  ORF type:complete len:185 (-),score=58.87 TRINITY_DN6688_c0_g1_i3:9-539(-)